MSADRRETMSDSQQYNHSDPYNQPEATSYYRTSGSNTGGQIVESQSPESPIFHYLVEQHDRALQDQLAYDSMSTILEVDSEPTSTSISGANSDTSETPQHNKQQHSRIVRSFNSPLQIRTGPTPEPGHASVTPSGSGIGGGRSTQHRQLSPISGLSTDDNKLSGPLSALTEQVERLRRSSSRQQQHDQVNDDKGERRGEEDSKKERRVHSKIKGSSSGSSSDLAHKVLHTKSSSESSSSEPENQHSQLDDNESLASKHNFSQQRLKTRNTPTRQNHDASTSPLSSGSPAESPSRRRSRSPLNIIEKNMPHTSRRQQQQQRVVNSSSSSRNALSNESMSGSSTTLGARAELSPSSSPPPPPPPVAQQVRAANSAESLMMITVSPMVSPRLKFPLLRTRPVKQSSRNGRGSTGEDQEMGEEEEESLATDGRWDPRRVVEVSNKSTVTSIDAPLMDKMVEKYFVDTRDQGSQSIKFDCEDEFDSFELFNSRIDGSLQRRRQSVSGGSQQLVRPQMRSVSVGTEQFSRERFSLLPPTKTRSTQTKSNMDNDIGTSETRRFKLSHLDLGQVMMRRTNRDRSNNNNTNSEPVEDSLTNEREATRAPQAASGRTSAEKHNERAESLSSEAGSADDSNASVPAGTSQKPIGRPQQELEEIRVQKAREQQQQQQTISEKKTLKINNNQEHPINQQQQTKQRQQFQEEDEEEEKVRRSVENLRARKAAQNNLEGDEDDERNAVTAKTFRERSTSGSRRIVIDDELPQATPSPINKQLKASRTPTPTKNSSKLQGSLSVSPSASKENQPERERARMSATPTNMNNEQLDDSLVESGTPPPVRIGQKGVFSGEKDVEQSNSQARKSRKLQEQPMKSNSIDSLSETTSSFPPASSSRVRSQAGQQSQQTSGQQSTKLNNNNNLSSTTSAKQTTQQISTGTNGNGSSTNNSSTSGGDENDATPIRVSGGQSVVPAAAAPNNRALIPSVKTEVRVIIEIQDCKSRQRSEVTSESHLLENGKLSKKTEVTTSKHVAATPREVMQRLNSIGRQHSLMYRENPDGRVSSASAGTPPAAVAAANQSALRWSASMSSLPTSGREASSNPESHWREVSKSSVVNEIEKDTREPRKHSRRRGRDNLTIEEQEEREQSAAVVMSSDATINHMADDKSAIKLRSRATKEYDEMEWDLRSGKLVKSGKRSERVLVESEAGYNDNQTVGEGEGEQKEKQPKPQERVQAAAPERRTEFGRSNLSMASGRGEVRVPSVEQQEWQQRQSTTHERQISSTSQQHPQPANINPVDLSSRHRQTPTGGAAAQVQQQQQRTRYELSEQSENRRQVIRNGQLVYDDRLRERKYETQRSREPASSSAAGNDLELNSGARSISGSVSPRSPQFTPAPLSSPAGSSGGILRKAQHGPTSRNQQQQPQPQQQQRLLSPQAPMLYADQTSNLSAASSDPETMDSGFAQSGAGSSSVLNHRSTHQRTTPIPSSLRSPILRPIHAQTTPTRRVEEGVGASAPDSESGSLTFVDEDADELMEELEESSRIQSPQQQQQQQQQQYRQAAWSLKGAAGGVNSSDSLAARARGDSFSARRRSQKPMGQMDDDDDDDTIMTRFGSNPRKEQAFRRPEMISPPPAFRSREPARSGSPNDSLLTGRGRLAQASSMPSVVAHRTISNQQQQQQPREFGKLDTQLTTRLTRTKRAKSNQQQSNTNEFQIMEPNSTNNNNKPNRTQTKLEQSIVMVPAGSQQQQQQVENTSGDIGNNKSSSELKSFSQRQKQMTTNKDNKSVRLGEDQEREEGDKMCRFRAQVLFESDTDSMSTGANTSERQSAASSRASARKELVTETSYSQHQQIAGPTPAQFNSTQPGHAPQVEAGARRGQARFVAANLMPKWDYSLRVNRMRGNKVDSKVSTYIKHSRQQQQQQLIDSRAGA